jgi:DNA ligase (NAD+)
MKQRIEELKSLIKQHDYNYYVLDEPAIEDHQYDALFQELLKLEQEHPQYVTDDSPTKRVGGTPSQAFAFVIRKTPMLSIRTMTNVTVGKILDWLLRVRDLLEDEGFMIIAEYKFDGLAIELKYESSNLVLASTRGDGAVGEDVTENVKMITNVPLRLFEESESKSIRGEVVMCKSTLAELNKSRSALGLKQFKNTRNAAAGSVRQADPNVTKSRKLKFIPYWEDVSEDTQPEQRFQATRLIALSELFNTRCNYKGFKINNSAFSTCERVAGQIYSVFEEVSGYRDTLDFEIDGLVLKIDSFRQQEKLGITGREPNWSVALKFPPQEAKTILESIDIQVGRTGKLTPVARLKPVDVGGTTVSNCTLSNHFEVRRKNLRVGDEVVVRRAGDVIPEIVPNGSILREPYVPNFRMPSACPVCGGSVKRLFGEMDYRCTAGVFCQAQKQEQFVHFCSRKGMKIDGVGEKIIEQLVSQNLIQSFDDIFKLSPEQLLLIEGFQKKSAEKLFRSIQASKSITMTRFIYALGIRHVGEETAKDLASRYSCIEEMFGMGFQELETIDGIGEKTASSLVEYFSDEKNKTAIANMQSLGVVIERFQKHANFLKVFAFVLTGSLSSMTREQAKAEVERLGGSVSGAVTKATTHLVVGTDPASSKVTKAEQLGISIIGEDKFLGLLK